MGMALRHSRNRKGIFILTNFQKKSIGENLILGFEKPYILFEKPYKLYIPHDNREQ